MNEQLAIILSLIVSFALGVIVTEMRQMQREIKKQKKLMKEMRGR